MKNVYVDASVLLRVVLDEPNQLSEWDSFEEPMMSTLVEVEGLRTIDRATRKGTHPRKKPLLEAQANVARTRLYAMLEMFSRIELGPSILTRAGQLAGPLGTLDALHLATALTWSERSGKTSIMATHDPELGLASAAHGLKVIGLS
jgi:predicted nucleic acid-binding protein